jgi:hypothetical protein
MFVTFIYGPAAAGKHTIGSILSAQVGLPLFHNHLTVDLATALFEFGSEQFRSIRSQVWRLVFREAAAAGKSFIFTFHPEATVEADLVLALSGIVEDAGGSMFFVELECSHAAVLGRLGMDSRTRFGKLTDPELYETIRSAGGFEFSGLPEPDLRIDTEVTEPADAAAAISAVIHDRGLV